MLPFLCASLFGVLCFGGVVAAMIAWGRHATAQRERAFATLASQYGLTVNGPRHLSGAFGGGFIDVVLTTESRGSGKSRRTVSVTRYRLRHPVPLRMGLKVHAQSQLFGDIAEALGLVSDIRVGRTDLDDAMRIGALDPAHAAAVLTGDAVTHAILGARALPRFYVNDQEAFTQHDGWISDPAQFEGSARPLARVVEALADARARHRAPWEIDLDRSWGSLAQGEGLEYAAHRSAIASNRELGSLELVVEVDTQLTTVARIAVARPLGYGLEMYRTSAMQSLGKLFGAQDVTIGVPAIDDAYTIKATNEAGARAVLASVSADLLRVHASFATLRVSDGGLEAKRPGVALDPVETTALLRSLARIRDALAGSVGESTSAFR